MEAKKQTKEVYSTPELDVVEFETEDVITTSGGLDNEAGYEGIAFM